jgi:hypothetical protein
VFGARVALRLRNLIEAKGAERRGTVAALTVATIRRDIAEQTTRLEKGRP